MTRLVALSLLAVTASAADYRFTDDPEVPAALRFGVLVLPETGAEADHRAPTLTAGLATEAPFLKSQESITVTSEGLTKGQGAWRLDLRARVIGDQITLTGTWTPTKGQRHNLERRYTIDPTRYTVRDELLGNIVLQVRIGAYTQGPNGALVPTK